ncbi:hypothetical protein F5887DRAFT_260151 [Amanita rubescens]|nr:hypothetical protein F5887DRAFT_260151 [Amanita rubescens]
MPALWGDISICLAYEDWKQTLSSARQWFDRAQDMRRSLFIRYYIAGNADVSPQLWKKLLEFMAQYRLEELDLVYPIHHVALKLPDHVWPSIERLHLKALTFEDIRLLLSRWYGSNCTMASATDVRGSNSLGVSSNTFIVSQCAPSVPIT